MIQCFQRNFGMLNTITITKHTWQSRHQMLLKHGNTTTMTEWPNSTVSNVKLDTVHCHHNTINFLQNIDHRYPIAHRLFQRARYVLCNVSSKCLTNSFTNYSLHCCFQYCVMLDHLTMAYVPWSQGSWGPSGADRTQVGPMLAPWTLLSGFILLAQTSTILKITVPTFNSSLIWQNMS